MKTTTFYRITLMTLLVSTFISISAKDKYSTTTKDLKDAYIGESTASAKYTAFSEKALKEGHDQIALLFKAAAKAESIHAGNHKSVLQQMGEEIPALDLKFDVKTTAENLQNAIEGETYEVTTMYPDFLKAASQENATLAMISFNYAYQVEKKHKALYEKALKALNDKTDKSLPELYMICTTCGNTYEGEAPARCGISMTPKERFVRITL